MGAAKERMIEERERGYGHVDGVICADCVDEDVLKEWVEAHSTETECSFCGRIDGETWAAPFEPFVELVMHGLGFDWNHPDDEGIMFISREGGYQAPVQQTYEVLYDCGISEDDDVVGALSDAIRCDSWVARDFYVGDDAQQLRWGWDRFKDIAKHRTRYFFQHGEDAGAYDKRLTPSDMLKAIAGSIRSDLGEYDLVRTLPIDTDVIRVRVDPEAKTTAADIGSPPVEHANRLNRMSPVGIPMFYGAFDQATALAERVEAEFERELIVERTKAGLAAARARGRSGGRPFKMTPAKLRLAQAAMGKPETKVAELCAELGVTRQTLYRHVTPKGEIRPDGEKLLQRKAQVDKG